jgi:hypothetical protein
MPREDTGVRRRRNERERSGWFELRKQWITDCPTADPEIGELVLDLGGFVAWFAHEHLSRRTGSFEKTTATKHLLRKVR